MKLLEIYMKKVELSGKNLEALPIKSVYFTDLYYDKISKEKTKDGNTYLSLVMAGRGIRGFKHLLEKLSAADSNAKIVFTNEETCKKNGNWYINLEEYKKSVSAKFFILYRETGLDGASHYLNQKMPEFFTYDKARMTENDYKKASKNLPKILEKLDTKKDKNAVVEQSLKIIEELSKKKTKVKAEIAELERIKNSSNIAAIISGLNEFEKRLNNEKQYKETSGKNSWQFWLKANSWIFGVLYGSPYEKVRVGFDNIPDYLFPTLDGFVDIYEIKLPSHHVVVEDKNHKGSFVWSSDANKAIGQCVNYLSEIELHQFELTDKIKKEYGVDLRFIKPRAFTVIGSDATISTVKEQEALRKLNYSLHGIEVITYSDLMRRGQQMLKLYGYDDSGKT